uniref:Uncharacterized protein n=1 Tax=Rhizophora mucronata TaxID=61149 RepID=A0A2P2P496_RHIMU
MYIEDMGQSGKISSSCLVRSAKSSKIESRTIFYTARPKMHITDIRWYQFS